MKNRNIIYAIVLGCLITAFLIFENNINSLVSKSKEFISIINLVPWFMTNNGYWVFYLMTLIDSTIITAVASVVASLGYYNIIIIILISIIGDLTGDVFYFFIGYNLRSKNERKYPLGISKEHVDKIKNMIHADFNKTVLLVKISPIITNPGLIIIGASGASFKKFLKIAFWVAVPKTIFFALFGFFSGKTYVYLEKNITDTSYVIIGIILFIILISYIYKKIINKIKSKIEINNSV